MLADRQPLPARFLILGSASRQWLRQSSESLAGRVASRTDANGNTMTYTYTRTPGEHINL